MLSVIGNFYVTPLILNRFSICVEHASSQIIPSTRLRYKEMQIREMMKWGLRFAIEKIYNSFFEMIGLCFKEKTVFGYHAHA